MELIPILTSPSLVLVSWLRHYIKIQNTLSLLLCQKLSGWPQQIVWSQYSTLGVGFGGFFGTSSFLLLAFYVKIYILSGKNLSQLLWPVLPARRLSLALKVQVTPGEIGQTLISWHSRQSLVHPAACRALKAPMALEFQIYFGLLDFFQDVLTRLETAAVYASARRRRWKSCLPGIEEYQF